MSDIGLTTMNVKTINRNHVYQYIYRRKKASKYQIVEDLKMGLTTVNQNLKLLEQDHLIEKNGFFESTGGRKAYMYRIVANARLAIGIGLEKDKIYLTAVDLYGTAVFLKTCDFPYISNEIYYEKLGIALRNFIEENQISDQSILGVSIATQGIISADGTHVSYGTLMNNESMQLSDFQKYIPFPCLLEHDSKAAAYAELWSRPATKNAIVILLNHNLGGGIICDGHVMQGSHMRSGLIEHFCVTPDGPFCYCGKRGCLETYCSASRLMEASKMKITDFFTSVYEQRSERNQFLWNDFLRHLAYAIYNFNILLDGDIIINGYLAPFFREEDITQLLKLINQSTPFPLSKEQIHVSSLGEFTSAIGSCLCYLENFIKKI